ncbi:hypothetical protein BDA96_07G045600 [Sorghum bicolor]|uniref:Caffeoyl-CoA O-methyltransferase n=2 Tax=Sorghum bicolor TaxID=4558 RepID=A0A921U9F6_SORBI|nr:uncharacterized protein LOC8076587 [Sorghum bicolor]EES13366.1 hypothetical protein SORBI_3007G043200 [Sorghum bicolor]KAG0522535.1 hypothetical protein BDA96_07G045600 [Sorghum bicolor]|eukprot:XP_002443871.1 uncharacterized protein LOC8076587 [Sorghum bicolor]
MSPRLAAAAAASALPLPLPPPAVAAPSRALRALVLSPGAAAAVSSSLRRRGAPACLVRRLCSSHHSSAAAATAATAATAVEEARRGRKQLGMTPPLYDYLLANVREHPILRELREETAAMRGSQMQVSPAQAQLLAMLVQILGAKRCIEVGVFTGYSSLAVALALPECGHLVACERDERCLEVAKKYYQRAGVAQKINVKHALAADSLRSLLDCGEASSYDFAFVDADKKMYEEYFELLLKLVRVGGLIVMDNVLWYGRVADPLVDDPKTISIRNFNKKVLEDKRVDISMVPIGDGMTICRKLVDT